MIKDVNPGPISRLAPTPSGYLHIGNAHNFLLTWWITRHLNGKLWLRIDDADSARSRKEYLDDIFESIRWLGLDWDLGPVNTEDFLSTHSQSLKKERYFQALKNARGLFACDCSRKLIKQESKDGLYPGICRNQNKDFIRGECALRVQAPPPMGDFTVWRKDDIPAYQLTNVVDDTEAGVDLIVRGEDLRESSLAQVHLAKTLGLNKFLEANIIHHPLITDEKGKKLSKSQSHGLSGIHLKFLRENGCSPTEIIKKFAENHGLDPKRINGPEDLLSHRPPFL